MEPVKRNQKPTVKPAPPRRPRGADLALAFLVCLFAAGAVVDVRAGTSRSRPVHLRCESATTPGAIDVPQPALSWELESRSHDVRQTGYRILVATTPGKLTEGGADLWDSGRVSSSDSIQVAYAGQPLRSGQRGHWKVRVWDETGLASDWSRPSFWDTAILDPGEWRACWIGAGPAREPRPAAGFFKHTNELASVREPVVVDSRATLLRREFPARRDLRHARVYVTGLGQYELFCNGRRVGDHVLAPAKTNYREWVLYDTYDLTPFLRSGTNALGMMLGNGWFNPARKWWEPYRMQWFGAKRGFLQLRLEYADGSSEWVVSDGSWKTAPGPVVSSCIYDGEVYDATLELPGWDQPGFDDRDWRPARVVEPPGGVLVSPPMPPIRVVEHRRPVTRRNPRPGVYVFDLGQNFAGWVRLTVRGPRGTRVTLRYAEDVHSDGTLDPRSNERAQATDVYVLRGEGREVYEPRFTYHGFQYVELTGFPGTPGLDDVLGCVVQTDCPVTGSFACDHDLLNRIHRATVWSQRSALLGYPLDCPQRDERLGWFGDAMVTFDEALCNFDAAPFFRHWLDGVRRNQNRADGDISIVSPRPYLPDEPDPVWSSAFVVMSWEYYRQQGDRAFLARQYDAMRRYVDYLGTQATNQVLPRYWIGDWGSIVEGWKEGDPPSVTTAFYQLDARIVSQAARVLGRVADAERYDALAQQIRAAYRRAYYDPGRRQFDQGTQFSNALPLCLGLAEPDEEPAVLGHILASLERRGGHFDVGVLGAKYLIEALTRGGSPDVAFRLATQTGYPGWAHMLEGGRTTLSEFWDLHGSHNHAMMGSIDAWFYRTLAGIESDENRPGYEHLFIRPYLPEALKWVRAHVATVRGPVSVSWEQRAGELRLRVELPANTTATVRVPAAPDQRIRCAPARSPAHREREAAIYELGSGRYEFRVEAR